MPDTWLTTTWALRARPANDRWYSNEKLAETYDWALEIAQHLEANGYQEFWMAEHHFQPEGYEGIPNLLMLGLYLATQTKTLKYGCGFNITPMWHPLRLAEDFAMADILSKGRIIFGVGRGYHTREVETFGSPMLDSNANRELFEEQVEVMIKAFNEDSFSHQGKHFQIPARVPYRGYELEKLTLVPRPLNRPVEIWQPLVSGNPRGVEFMAKTGIKPLLANTPEPTLGERMRMYQQAQLDVGRETQLGENAALGFRMFLAESKEKAIEKARPYYEEAMKFAAPLGLMALQPGADRRRGRWRARWRQAAHAGGGRRGRRLDLWPGGVGCRGPKESRRELPGRGASQHRLRNGYAAGGLQGPAQHLRRRGDARLQGLGHRSRLRLPRYNVLTNSTDRSTMVATSRVQEIFDDAKIDAQRGAGAFGGRRHPRRGGKGLVCHETGYGCLDPGTHRRGAGADGHDF